MEHFFFRTLRLELYIIFKIVDKSFTTICDLIALSGLIMRSLAFGTSVEDSESLRY